MSAWIGLAELALGGCTTSTDHLYVHPRGGGDLISAEIRAARRARHALPSDPRLDEPVAEGRWAAARLRRAGRRRDPRRLRAARRASPRPASGRDGADRARAVLAVQRDTGADAPHRRAGRTARRPAAHPPRRGPRRGHVRGRALRLSHHRPLRVGRVDDRSQLGRALHLPERRRDRAARRGGRRRRALPELEHDDRRRRHRSGRGDARRQGHPSGSAATAPRRPTRRRSGWRPATRCCWAGCAAVRHRPAAARCARDRDAGRGGRASVARASSASCRSARLATSSFGRIAGDIAHAGAISDPIEAWLRCAPVRRAPHGRRGRGRGLRRRPGRRPAWTRCSRWHRRVAERFQAP